MGRTYLKEQKTIIVLISGGMGRIFAVTLVNPLELVRTKMQSQRMKFYQGNNIQQKLTINTALFSPSDPSNVIPI